ncbi:MAG: ribonuclease HII [Lentisphaerae bacterium]|nr:ribonuclease HII [Lentisphaerota bacterium]
MSRRTVLSLDDELLRSERELRAEGFCWIAGVDEAGRGPLAGPVTAGAVILPWHQNGLPGVFDSKQLSAEAREELYEELLTLENIDIGIGIADVEEIDKLNILKAAHLAMFRAVAQLKKVDCVLVDGLPVKGFEVPSRNLIKGDARSASIAAASIVAKVVRDRMMMDYDAKYPEYGFASHKGYGSAEHLEALRKYGACPIHRKSFRPVAEVLPETPVQQELEF